MVLTAHFTSSRYQSGKEICQISGQWRGKLHRLPSGRMNKAQLLRVQKLPAEIANARSQARVLHRIVASCSIGFISHHWMFEPVEMHAYLVGASGFDLNVEQGKSLITATNSIVRQRSEERRVGKEWRCGEWRDQ